jgi:hypothetical protein
MPMLVLTPFLLVLACLKHHVQVLLHHVRGQAGRRPSSHHFLRSAS